MSGIRGNTTGREAGRNNSPTWDERLSFRPNELPKLTGMSRSKIFEMIADGTLPSKLISGCRVIARKDLLNLIQSD